MKGDFSHLPDEHNHNFAGVLHQQGRVLLDADWNAQTAIANGWQDTAGQDIIGAGVAAVPADQPDGFKIASATHGAGTTDVQLTVIPGRVWADGLLARVFGEPNPDSTGAVPRVATYLTPPVQPAFDTFTIAKDVRDAVILEVWREELNGFQLPGLLIEPALGGPDTTERVNTAFAFRLMRLGAGDTCENIAGRLKDNFGTKGKLKVSLQPSSAGSGECPTPAGGGYTGFEHNLYRIEIAAVDSGQPQPQFKWSQYGGGLVGRGHFDAASKQVTIKANLQAITNSGLSSFYLEALERDPLRGHWRVTYGAPATLSNDVLTLDTTKKVFGTFPANPVNPLPTDTTFFRLWNGIGLVKDFGNTALPNNVGIILAFDAPTAGNYVPGDYWTFPVRAGEVVNPEILVDAESPKGIHYHRVPLAVLTWKDAKDVQPIEDCRKCFRPLTNQKICCSFNVGDGKTSFGDFNSIELALRHLPAAGGEICLLPGLHTTNALIDKRVNVTIRGCGARTRVLPREKTLTAPIFTVRDSTRIEIEHMDLVTLGGTAILIEGSRPGACDDISITRHRFLACTHAVLARNASHLTIAHNRIRMLDKADGLAAIDIAADDALIERNEIALVPAERTPPVDPDDPDPVDPVDPCAKLERIYLKPLIFASYVNQLWALKLPLLLLLTLVEPYRALGGIQIRGGSERVRILENHIAGGGGNGITLGNATAVVKPPAPPAPRFTVREADGNVHGSVIGPDGKPLAGVQITLTHLPDGAQRTVTSAAPKGEFFLSVGNGTYEVSEGAVGLEIDKFEARHGDAGPIYEVLVVLKQSEAPSADDTGFLYDVAIERNHIAAMGLSGIGVPGIPAAGREAGVERALRMLGAPVIGLAIRDNRIVHNLRNPFDDALRAQAAVRGLGGVSLGLADDVAITGNRIEGNGVSGADPACGIFIQYGESVEIARNVILDNGPAPAAADATIRDGERGGIVLGLAANFGPFALLRGRAGDRGAAATAARILANQVEQPVGCALLARAFGPVMIDDNVFASERSSVGGLDALAGTVLVVNLAGVQARGPSVQMKASFSTAASAASAPSASTQPVGNLATGARLQPAPQVERPSPPPGIAGFAAPLLPFGSVLFNDNQTRAGAAHTSPLTQLLIAYDDVGFATNQCYTDQESNVFANTAVLGTSLRATGNRLRERYAETLLSLLTISSRANNTTFNQGDHCIIAQDTDPAPPATMQVGNQVLFPSKNCPSFNMTTALLFKPLG